MSFAKVAWAPVSAVAAIRAPFVETLDVIVSRYRYKNQTPLQLPQ